MKRTTLATLIAATSFGSIAAPTTELNRDEIKDYTYLTTVSPTMAKLAAGLEFGNPEAVQEALSEFKYLSTKEKFATLTILNNTNIYESEYESVLDQLINGGNVPNLPTELKNAYNAFTAGDKHITGDFHEIRKTLKENNQAGFKPIDDVIIDPIITPIAPINPIDEIVPILDPIPNNELRVQALAEYAANKGAVIDRTGANFVAITTADGNELKLKTGGTYIYTDENGDIHEGAIGDNGGQKVTEWLRNDVPQIDPIKDPIQIDPITPKWTEEKVRSMVEDIQKNGSVHDKVEGFNKAMEATNNETRLSLEEVKTESGETTYQLMASVGGSTPVAVTEEDFKDAAKEKSDENQKARGGDNDPIEGVNPIVGNPDRHEERKENREVGVNPIEGEPEIKPTPQGSVLKAAAQQQANTQAQMDELYALGNQNASDIDTLFSEVDRLDTRIDQTQALNAATVNARPMVQNGMTAFGAGVGYAGSEAALAIGVAHSFVDTGWSASGTLAASSDDVVVGAGAQYAF